MSAIISWVESQVFFSICFEDAIDSSVDSELVYNLIGMRLFQDSIKIPEIRDGGGIVLLGSL